MAITSDLLNFNLSNDTLLSFLVLLQNYTILLTIPAGMFALISSLYTDGIVSLRSVVLEA